MKKVFIIWLLLVVLALTGYVKNIIKLINCDWDPVGKAEVIYTIGAVTGTGAIIGWFDIEDSKEGLDVELKVKKNN